MIAFGYEEPATLAEALELLAQHGEAARPLAGGTALVNLIKQRLVRPELLVSLRRVPGIDGIAAQDGELRLGALCTHLAIERSALVQARAPLLSQALRQLASVRIRSIATLGGALAHADPNQDLPPALIALDARARLRSPGGERELPVEALFRGYYETVLEAGELITEVSIPEQPRGSGGAFLKFLPRTQDDYATVAVAASIIGANGRIEDVRVALGAAGETPLRARAVESALRGQQPSDAAFAEAAELVLDEVDPIADFRGSAEYKRAMAAVFVRRALIEASRSASAASPPDRLRGR